MYILILISLTITLFQSLHKLFTRLQPTGRHTPSSENTALGVWGSFESTFLCPQEELLTLWLYK